MIHKFSASIPNGTYDVFSTAVRSTGINLDCTGMLSTVTHADIFTHNQSEYTQLITLCKEHSVTVEKCW